MVPHDPQPGNPSLPHSVACAGASGRGFAAADAASALRTLFDLPPRDWPGAGLRSVKQTTVRTVYQGSLHDTPVHVKVFRPDTFSDRARDFWSGARAERELANLHRARALGLPVPQPLAIGLIGASPAQSFLATRTIDGATPFTFGSPEAAQQTVGALLRAAHDRGFLPGDLHPGNVVLDRVGRAYLLDVTSVRHGGEPDLGRRAAALAFFCQALDGGALDPRARTLLRAYLAAGRALPARFRDHLAQYSRAVRRRALRAFGRRSSRPCRHTEVHRGRRGEPDWYLHTGPAAEGQEPLWTACREFAASALPPPLRAGRRGAVWLFPEFAVKQRPQGAARHLFEAMYWLQFAGVPEPQPVALRTQGDQGLVFAQRLPGESLANAIAGGHLDEAAIAAAARSLGRSMGRLHAHGLRNRDLKFENLVFDAKTGTVSIVDLDGVRRKSPGDYRGQGADLGRALAAFRTAGSPGGDATLRRFALAYLLARLRLLDRPDPRRLWRGAERRAAEWVSAHA
jgi:tRNA A-37 threonylcarbamoyl transferase component Bud32